MHSLVISSEAVYGGVERSQTNHNYEFLIMNYELIRDAVRIALCACFSLAPSSDAALSFLREAYTEPENAPRPARTADVCYWSLSPDYGADPASWGADAPASGSHIPTVQRFLPFRLLVVCYGPGAEANAAKVRSFLFLDGANCPRKILRKAGIYPIPDPPPVQLLFEPEGSLWRRRADVSIPLRILDTEAYENRRGAISIPPAVVIHR